MKFKDYIISKYIDDTRSHHQFIGGDLTDLNGIEKYTATERLYLSNNKIKNIEPLKFLPNLNYLDISDNKITNIDSLKYSINLSKLYLNFNDISDLSSLYNLTKLKELSLWGVPIIDKDLEDLFYHNKNIEGIWIEKTLVSKIFKRGWIAGRDLAKLKNELIISRRKRLISLLN